MLLWLKKTYKKGNKENTKKNDRKAEKTVEKIRSLTGGKRRRNKKMKKENKMKIHDAKCRSDVPLCVREKLR